ncbi:hypothetical protein QN219_22810 [Sinorhizobium sp. 7-81]|nr:MULTISPECIES: hypothetical protein [unclassified Sinorhizobium]MDK1389413.1 hypothetical protein [Sinorhizobium sp. 7-81]MDK1492858.1 hypothetical protein [Sinorhizobium sp. 8-89]
MNNACDMDERRQIPAELELALAERELIMADQDGPSLPSLL